MKINIVLLVLFAISNLLGQVNYYHYQNRLIKLNQRFDKIAVVLNTLEYSKNHIEDELKRNINPSDEIKEIYHGVMLINFSGSKSDEAILQYKNKLEGNYTFVKFVTPVYYGEARTVTQIPTDEFIVRLKNKEDIDKLNQLNTTKQVIKIDNIQDANGFLLKTLDGVKKNALELSKEYFDTGLFEYAEPNFVYPEGGLLHYVPNDPFFTSQWALRNTGQSVATGGSTSAGDLTTANGISDADMDVDLAWDFTTGSSAVKIGVIDTGIDSTHPDLMANVIEGYDAVWNKYGVPRDSGSHGTACAGLIGAVINNSLGVAGIVPNSKIMAIRIFNSSGSTTDAAIVRAFDTARVRGIDVLSNSWGGGTPSNSITNAINNAALNGRGGKGCIILVSSGNEGRNPPSFPSYLSNVICVGASTPHDQKKAPGTGNQFWWGGNYGEDSNGDIDCVAPTVCYTTDIQGSGGYNTSSGTSGDYYATFNGTSCSCPNAAGVAALILSINTNFTRLQVTEFLLRGTEKIDNIQYSTLKTYGYWNEYTGYGRVNAYHSVRLAAGVDVTPPSIIHQIVASHSSTRPTIITATITDQDGQSVPISGSNQPKLYFRINKNNSGWTGFDSVSASSNSGANFTFQIPGQGWETQIQYYIIGRDNSGNETTFPKGAPNPFWLCNFAVGQITTSSNKNSAFTIASSGTSQSADFTIGNNIILDAKAQIYLRHTYLSDISVILRSPSSDANQNRKVLFARNGGSGDNITGATVSDSMINFWRSGTPPYLNSSFKPDYLLNGLIGTSSNGNWRIIVYDAVAGDGGTCDSIRVTIYRTTGITSSSARLNSGIDSTVDFGVVSFPSMVIDSFYLKNDGTANLTVGSVNFTGTYAYMFSLDNVPPTSIAPNDSGLFIVKLNTQASPRPGLSFDNPESEQAAVMNITTNDPSKSLFKVSLISDNPLPIELESFIASAKGRNVELNWQTATEVNSSKFVVERKTDKQEKWNVVGEVTASGNSNSPKEYRYVDNKLNSGNYQYRLRMVDIDGTYSYSDVVETTIELPREYGISQNYPNPFNPTTRIDYQLPFDSKVLVELYTITGERVAEIVNKVEEAGYYTIELDGSKIRLSSGVYIYRIVAESVSEGKQYMNVKKMMMIK